MLALAVAAPQAAVGQSLCVEDLDAPSSFFESDARIGARPRQPSRDRRRRGSEPGSVKIERTAGALDFGGHNPTVYGGYSGCGERVDLDHASGQTRLSYARSEDWNPWRRLNGDPFAAEHFFDAEVEAPGDGPLEAGYALNMYAAETEDPLFGGRQTTRNVTGSAFWLSGLDDRIKLSSSLGMDAPTGNGRAPLAQHHEVEVEPLRFGEDGALFFDFSYADADEGFSAGRGAYVPADARSWGFGGGVHSDGASVRLDYRRGRDNLSNDGALTTHALEEMAGRIELDSPIGGFLVPDLITLRGSLRDDREGEDGGSESDRLRHATAGWGINMLWRDDARQAGIDVSGQFADTSALASAGVLPSQRLGLSLGGDTGAVQLSGRLYSERQIVNAEQGVGAAMDYGGSLAATAFGQRLEGSLAYGRTVDYVLAPTLRWGLAAELDAGELFGRDFLGQDLFALGRLESRFAEDVDGWRSDYTAKLVAGFRF
jgi:hypothetical protein